METEITKTYNAAVRQQSLLEAAILGIVKLQEHKFYPIGHYSKEIKLLRSDLKAVEDFLAV